MQNQPNSYDVVLGGQSGSPHDGVVLGGLDGVRQQLNAPDEAVRVAALKKAFDYGDPGLDLVIEVLRDDLQRMGWDAYWVLSQRPEAKAQAALTEYGLLHNYEVVTVNKKGDIIRREPKSTRIFRESLGEVSLDLVPIPRGTFLMGSPQDELGRRDSEGPQHEVTVPPFLMGRFPITQAQWRAVAQLEQVNQKLDPDPSRFKGDNRPVEQVSWYNATEFCARLSKFTGRDYRLPSEAEWEYACRAGTTTPFYFGETITSDLANYDGSATYGQGPQGIDRKETTEVGSFPPNAFGLYDMHGNVWEWCLDYWHENYQGAPTDGSAWTAGGDDTKRLQRGGSWRYYPGYCRSADRARLARDKQYNSHGFRVVCASSWAL